MIQDELFKDNEELMTDETLLFLIAATQTTSTMVTECLFRMTQHKHVLKKVRDEIKTLAPQKELTQMTEKEWRETLTYEKVSEMKYLGMVLNETLRVCAPVNQTTDFCFTEDVVLNGVKIKKGMELALAIQYIH